MVTLLRLLHFICLERKKPCTLVCFKKNPDSGLSTSLWIFPPHHGRESTADTSVFIGFLNGERLAMNRLRFLLIIINNASLPIYLSRTHTPLLLVAPTSSVTHNPSPITHTSCTHALTFMHIIHTPTPISPIQIPSSVAHHPPTLFPNINLTLSLSSPHLLTSPLPLPHFHPSLVLVSHQIWLLQRDLHCAFHEDKSKRSEDFLWKQSDRIADWKKSHPLWNPFKALCEIGSRQVIHNSHPIKFQSEP